MISVTNKTGRLVEVRALSPLSLEELAQFKAELIEIIKRLGQKFTACVDLRQLKILQPPQAEAIQKIFLADNPMLERSAILFPEEGAALAMQFERLIQEAKNPSRRSFRAVEPLVLWLREVSSMQETIRLKVFLDEPSLEQSLKK